MRAVSQQKGFTLLELLITIAIVGIISAVAYPQYQSMVAGSYRSTAQSDLLALAAAMERHYSANFSYKGAAESGADTGKPATFSHYSPATEPYSERRYDLTIQAVATAGSSYEILAMPISGSAQATDGRLVYYSDGRKGWDQNNNGTIDSSEFCWNC